MNDTESGLARQIAEAASAFQQARTGHAPKAVTVVLSEDTLVVTLHEALTPAERDLAQSAAGAAQRAGVSPAALFPLLRIAAAGDQAHHRP